MAKKKTTRSSPIVLQVGQEAPDFKLPDQANHTHQLKDYRGRWVVLYFYPKDNTPGCTNESCQFRDLYPRLERHNAVVLGISPDSAESHDRFAAKLGLPFHLLADVGSKVCEAYGLWQQKSMFGRKYMGVVRTTFLIDPQGRIAERWDKVKVTGHGQAVLAKLAELRQSDTRPG